MKHFIPLLLIFLTACTAQTANQCTVDSDCVKASCCHAEECVPVSHAPDCEGIFCSAECVPGTLDCNQGECSCVDGFCSVTFS